ncbi:MAG TPA: DUF1385 domain-containing protein [Anaerolineae bacterium]|nr:DUF1385 domain-containing protein [Anaerolineae bacterium]HQH39167.1 DUF1385 domain-containing protein [Anaerolineae bacterium]
MSEDTSEDTVEATQHKTLGWSYGGQAVIEGVMMRGQYNAAIAVRRPDGEVVVKQEPLGNLYRGACSKIPFLRGVPMLWDSLGLGMKALFFSAEVVGQAEDPEFTLSGGMGIASGALGLLGGMALFMVLPSFVAGLLVQEHALLFNLVEGLIRLALLIGYIAAVGQMEDIRRVFAYHGAEHKTVNAHETGAPLTVESVRTFSTAHARCGTAFLLIVVFISILVFVPLGQPAFPIRIASRLLLLPVIAGIAYEVLRFTGKHAHNPIIRAIITPNLALQRLTTREPDDGMLEVAITALETVLAGEFPAT